MKTVTRESDCEIEIPIVHITAGDFVQLLGKSVGTSDSIELTIGQTFDTTYTVLENLNEIQQHQSSISIPFSVETQGVTLLFRSYGVTLRFSDDARGPANTLASRLSEFKPWYTIAFKPWFAPASLIPFWLFLSTGLTESLHISISAVAMILLFLPAAFSLFSYKLQKPRLIQREREGFWRRNRDAVAMLLLGTAGSLLITSATNYLSSQEETPASIQTETTKLPSNE